MDNIKNKPSFHQRNFYKKLTLRDLNEKYFKSFLEKIEKEKEDYELILMTYLWIDQFKLEHIKEYNLSQLDLQLILTLAIYADKKDIVKSLLNFKVDPDCRLAGILLETKELPVQKLVQVENPSDTTLEILELLLQHKCSIDVFIINELNETTSINLLEIAYNYKNYDMCKYILKYDPDSNLTLSIPENKSKIPLLAKFIKTGNLDLLKEAAKHIHDSDIKILNWVFFYAVINGKKEEVKIFLKQGLNLKNIKNSIKKEKYTFTFFELDVETDEELEDFEKKLNELEKEIQN